MTSTDRAFDWSSDPYPEFPDPPMLDARSRRAQRKGLILFKFAIRVEPQDVAQLLALCCAVIDQTDKDDAADLDAFPTDTDRSLYMTFGHYERDLLKAHNAVWWRVRRMINRTGIPIRRISLDSKPVEA